MSANAKITLPENSEATWAWLAGILDGEGSFYVNAKRGYAAISIGMKDQDVIRRVADTMGCKSIWLAPKRIWRCAVQGRRALLVMDRVYSWMGNRRSAKIDEVREAVKELPGQARGERAGNARLTEQQVQKIHALFAEGHLQREIGLMFGVTQANVSSILQGKNWSHLAKHESVSLLMLRRNERRTYCKAGHLRSEVGTVTEGNWLRCRECKRITGRKYYLRKRLKEKGDGTTRDSAAA